MSSMGPYCCTVFTDYVYSVIGWQGAVLSVILFFVFAFWNSKKRKKK